jgi:hypothetical protein
MGGPMRPVMALALLLAGCLAAPAPTQPGTAGVRLPPADGGRAFATAQGAGILFHIAGRMGVEAESKVAGFFSPGTANTTLQFQVHSGATGIVAELAWPDAASDLDLQLFSPSFCPRITQPTCPVNGYFGNTTGTGTWRNEGGSVGHGDSPARLRLGQAEVAASCPAEACRWQLAAWAKLTAGTSFDLYATVFYGGAPPANYTAVPSAP